MSSIGRLQLLALAVFACSLVVPCWSVAQEATPPAAADIPALITALDAEEFATREQASEKLVEAGEAAVPALEKAVTGESREAASRAFDILKNHFQKGTPGLRDSARQALERIAQADLGSTSRHAKELVAPPKTPPGVADAGGRGIPEGMVPLRMAPGFRPPFGPGFGPGFIPGGPIPFPVPAMPAGGRAVRTVVVVSGGVETKVQNVDGVKTTEVKEKDRTTKVVEDPDTGITVEVTETKDGKEVVEKFAAKDADELKTKHPEAFEHFENAKKFEAPVAIRIAPFGAPPFGAIPFDGRPADAAPVPAAEEGRLIPDFPSPEERMKEFEKAREEIRARMLERMRALDGRHQGELDRARREMEAARDRLRQLREAPGIPPREPAPRDPALP
jgi:hypothetical protein